MASSYTGLGTELMTTGENAGTWGSTTNTNLQIIEQIAGGYIEKSIAGGAQTTTLTVSDGSTGAELSHRILKFTGTITGNQVVTIPLDVQQMFILVNGTSGAYTVQFKYASGSGSSLTFAATDKGTKLVYATADDGTNPNLVDSGISSTGAHDLDGNEFILDADADTSITADTDDQIDIKIAGADDFQFTANTFTAQSGSTIAAQALTATTITASGIVKTDDTTEATSTTDGSLQTDGGLSVAKDAVLGDDLKLLSDSAVLSFGADSDTTLTHTDGTGLTLNSTNKLLFRDSALSISSSTDGQLDIDADTEVEIATTTLDLNGALDVSGASQFSGAITVGVDDTGLDVKLFGASAGAYMEWDESADQLRIMGASADATTSTGKLLLATSLTDINANDVIGKIEFQAPHEAGGTDAITVAASIQALAQATFSSSVNATDLIFYTGHSEANTEKFRFTSQGELGVGGANYGTDGQVLTSTGAGTAPAWEDASGGAVTALNNATQSELVTVGSTTTELDAEANLTFTGSALTCIGTITTGVDNTGHDVKFFGATSGSFLLWDESDDALELTDSSPIKIGDGGDMTIYHDGTDSFVTNATGALKLATETSGIVVTIGHTTSETTVADNLTITGTTVGTSFDLNGTADGLILDANGNTTISSPTDDQIDFEIAGADDFTMTANTFTILSGSTIAIAAGGAITNAGSMAPDITSTGKALVFGF